MEQHQDNATRLERARALPPRLRVGVLAEAMWIASEDEREVLAGLLIELAAPAVPSRLGKLRERLPRVLREVAGDGGAEIRGRAAGALAGVWEIVPPAMRPLAAAACLDGGEDAHAGRVSRFEDVVPVMVTSQDPRVRRSVARLIVDLRLAGSLGVLGTLATDPEHTVRRVAAESLLRLALLAAAGELAQRGVEVPEVMAEGSVAREGSVGVWEAEIAVPLCRALAVAIQASEVRGSGGLRRDLMVAAILAGRGGFGGRGGEAGRIILRAARAEGAEASAEDATLGTLRSAIRTTAAPLAGLRAVEWLAVPALHRTCCDRLAAPRSATDVELALGASHLLLRPARAKRERSDRAGAGSERGGARAMAGVARMSVTARLGAVRMAEWMRMGPEGKEAALTPLLADPAAAVRQTLARGASGALLGDVLFDREEMVARQAFLRWSLAGTGLSRSAAAGGGSGSAGGRAATLSRLTRSAHASVRAFAADERELMLAPGGLGDRLSLRRLMAANPAAAVDGLRERMAGPDLAACERCLVLVRGLGLAEEMSESLLGLLGRVREMADPAARRLTAGLAMLLGEIPARAARDAAAELLAHEDARVGANAVEALAKLTRAAAGKEPTPGPEADKAAAMPLMELKADPRHRVRANALRALIEEGGQRSSAIEALASMLQDDRVGHRLASSWVLWRVLPEMARRGPTKEGGAGWPLLAARATRLASFDPDERVRRRAAACVSRLSITTGGAWSPVA